jgi:uncharacterized membrane protein
VLNSLILFFLVITQVLGDVCISQGMKIYGEITSFSPQAIIDVIQYLFTSFWFYAGLGSLTVSWLLYLSAVAKMDLSYVLPIHASSYILNGFMAWLLLHETVTPVRWIATIIISIGVFIVGLSQYISSKQPQKLTNTLQVDKGNITKVMATLPFSGFLSPVWLGVISLVLADSTGDLLSAKGMKQVGALTKISVGEFFRWFSRILTNIYMIIGITCQSMSLLFFLSLLSWDDLSLIRPATSLGYIISLVSAKYILHENINRGRLVGIACIGLGIFSLSLS